MITENSLGQKINNPENFWKWFGNSVTVDAQGRPLVLYHGTKQRFNTFKTKYDDELVFFAYDKQFSLDWGGKLSAEQEEKKKEVNEPLRKTQNSIAGWYRNKYGTADTWSEGVWKEYKKQLKHLETQAYHKADIDTKIMPVYLKVSKIFYPEKDYELVLDDIIKCYELQTEAPDNSKEIEQLENEMEVLRTNYIQDCKQNGQRSVTDEEKQQMDNLIAKIRELEIPSNNVWHYENEHLPRIKKGAWVYFENKVIIDKIWSLGFDAIELSEKRGEPTTLAVRKNNNQIKSIFNKGGYDSSENIYEEFNDNFYKWFGNSKVVDSNGNPLIVYHGTDNEFGEFKLKKHKNDSGFYGAGFYFSNTPSEASYYGKIIMPCFLKMNKPLIINHSTTDLDVKQVEDASLLADLGFLKDDDIIKSVKLWKQYRFLLEHLTYKQDGSDWIVCFTNTDLPSLTEQDKEWLKYERPIGNGYSKESAVSDMWKQIKEHFKIDTRFSLTDYLREHSYEFSDFLKKKGYDGVIADDEYVVFNANQIKSVNNKGTWSLSSNNIYESLNKMLERYL